MPATYEPIATQTLGAAAASVTFSSIPATFTDLVLVGSMRSTRSGAGNTQDFPALRLNGDSGNNYSRTAITGQGSTASSSRFSNEGYAYGAFISTSLSAANVFTPVIYQIQNYSNTTTNKTILCRSNQSESQVMAIVNLWRNTSAINEIIISLPASGSNLETGSTFTLYGIKAA